MAVALTVTWGYARPIPNNSHHYIPVFYGMTGGGGQYQKNINGGGWIDVNLTDPQQEGKVIQWTIQHSFATFGLRDKNNPGDEIFVGVEIPYQPQFPEETDTPQIVSTSITSGASKLLTIKTKNPNSVVRLYGSQLSGTEGFYDLFVPLLAQGTSDSTGQCILTIASTLRTNQILVPTAQDTNKCESLATNKIIVGGARNNQLDISYTQGQSTNTGRLLQFSISGGTAPYTMSTNNDEVFVAVPTTPVDYPYGIDWIVFRDATDSRFAFTVKVFNETTVISNPKFLSTYELLDGIIATKGGEMIQLSKRKVATNITKYYFVRVLAVNQRILRTSRVGEVYYTAQVPVPNGWTLVGGSSGALSWDTANNSIVCNVDNTTTFIVATTGNGGTGVEFQFDTNTNWIPANVGGFNNRYTISCPSDGTLKQFKARIIGQTNFIYGSLTACTFNAPNPTGSVKIYPIAPVQEPFYYIDRNPVQFKSKVQVSGLRIWDEAWNLSDVNKKRWITDNGTLQSGVMDVTLPSEFIGKTVSIRILHYWDSNIVDTNIKETNDYLFLIQ